ncbi:MAG: tRNA 4-thiouridine(8) synthase ThiI [Clostridium sp.]|nr:tRNA 4-thiouridine(8) synthase ThiI [Clostridium sp.]MCM1444154.1 tRNA 4-thiouridine(8) synthase ThiI [Candidatus Amulumruptor caecigallinarius]
MEKLLLVKYAELTTKKGNRKQFIKILYQNIEHALLNTEYEIKYNLSCMYIKTSDKYLNDIIHKLSNVFGIHSITVSEKVNNNIDDIGLKVIEVLKMRNFKTFKIETKRSDKNFKFTSLQTSSKIGAIVLKNIDCSVDVHNPDITVFVEIRNEGTYIYIDFIKGLGGYPVGIQGKGLLMLSGGIDSPVAGYLSLKRGVNIECLYFESLPHTSIEARNKVLKLASILNNYSKNIKVHVVPFTKIQETIYKNVEDSYIITIMRRMMYRIASIYSKKLKCKIIINGESIGQVASQTLTSMSVINNVTNIPIIRPVVCMDKLEIIEVAKKINTYETSILPYEDCCTIFLPKHPVINPELNKCLEFEKKFNYENLIDEAINNIKIFKVDEKKNDLL